jgi:translocation and assembly module TamA
MKKLVRLIIVLVCFPLVAAHAKPASLDINGVSGKVLANVEKRLNELQELKPLNEISPDELRNQIIKAMICSNILMFAI